MIDKFSYRGKLLSTVKTPVVPKGTLVDRVKTPAPKGTLLSTDHRGPVGSAEDVSIRAGAGCSSKVKKRPLVRESF